MNYHGVSELVCRFSKSSGRRAPCCEHAKEKTTVQVAEAEVYIPTGVDVVELAAAEHQCATKCSEGCTGP